ncbi:MAG: sigma-70 family RNA polymerase sigma factor [Ruminococcaceae bacterium]|nr:sigma-70 family RNA polymerase sigma factor [Oscillospiraceae bacterium]
MEKAEEFSMSKEVIIQKYFDMIYRLALARAKDREIAEDVCQDVFLRYIKTDKVFQSEEHIKAWLIRVCINCTKSVFTGSWFKKTVPLSQELEFSSPEYSDLYEQVKKLPKKYATVIHLFYYEDMSVSDIAKLLNQKESTVKSHLFRGRNQLKELLGGRYDYEF